MPILVGCFALIAPRVTIIVMAIVSDYIGTAYQNILWPILGFFFMPLTVLAYAWAHHSSGGDIQGLGIVVIVLAVLVDLGIIGGSGKSGKKVIHRSRYVER